MHDAKKRPRWISRLKRARRKSLWFSLACYLFAMSGLVARALYSGEWQEWVLMVSSIWIPISLLGQWRAWLLIDGMMELTTTTMKAVVSDHRVVHPIALFVTQVDGPDAEGDIRQVGHGKVNIRELRN